MTFKQKLQFVFWRIIYGIYYKTIFKWKKIKKNPEEKVEIIKQEVKQVKLKRGPIQIYKIDYYHYCPILIQKIGYDIWQWIIVRRDKFYQGWILIKPKWYRWFLGEPYTLIEKANIVNWCLNAARTTIDTLEEDEKIKKKDARKPKNK